VLKLNYCSRLFVHPTKLVGMKIKGIIEDHKEIVPCVELWILKLLQPLWMSSKLSRVNHLHWEILSLSRASINQLERRNFLHLNMKLNLLSQAMWCAPKSRGETHLRVSQSQVAESWDLEARSRLPILERGRGSSWEPRD
jgi:hypothetical protein